MNMQKFIIGLLLIGLQNLLIESACQDGIDNAKQHCEKAFSELAGAMALMKLDFDTEFEKYSQAVNAVKMMHEAVSSHELKSDKDSMLEKLPYLPSSEFIKKYDELVVDQFMQDILKILNCQDGRDSFISSFFHYMLQEENVFYFKDLLSKKIKKIKYANGVSLLEMAVLRKELWLVKLLIALEVDLNNYRNRLHKTYLDIAIDENCEEIIDVLLQAGAKKSVNILNDQHSSQACIIS